MVISVSGSERRFAIALVLLARICTLSFFSSAFLAYSLIFIVTDSPVQSFISQKMCIPAPVSIKILR